ncbi:S8 family serine peptidase, partial [bacterium]|nr:S8 family serine peptidase [bacterium]
MMTRFRPLLLLGTLAVSLAACGGGGGPAPVEAAPTAIGPVSGLPVDAPGLERYIVMLDSDAADTPGLAAALAGLHGAAPTHVYTHALQGFAVQLPPAAAALLAADPRVALVETDMEAHIVAQTLPPGIDRAEADANTWAAIDGVDTRVDVDVASIDTGIDLDHPDLNVYRNVTFVRRTKNGNDDNGHGSHTAGTMAALDNGFGVVGMAPGARLWAVKVLDRRGAGYWSDIIAGMDYVTDNAGEIDVANMSLGSTGLLSSVRTALQGMVNAGVVVVVAAGNSSKDVYGSDGVFGTSDDFFPASYPEAMAVSAMKDNDGVSGGAGGSGDDQFASFTNFSRSVVGGNPVTSTGKAIDLAAPGVSVLSTYKNGNYATISGTSMSSPHVAGGAALYIAEHGRATNAAGVAAIRQALIDQGKDQSAWQSGST